MTATLVSNTVNHGILPGYKGGYGADITITSSGAVNGATYAVYGVYLVSNVSIVNAGHLHAGAIPACCSTLRIISIIRAASMAADLVSGCNMVLACSTPARSPPGMWGVGLQAGSSLRNQGLISGNTLGVQIISSTASNIGTIFGGVAGVALEAGYLANSGNIGGTSIVSFSCPAAPRIAVRSRERSRGVAITGGAFINSGSIGGTDPSGLLRRRRFTNSSTGRISGTSALRPTPPAPCCPPSATRETSLALWKVSI